eukprot:3975614-Alexandrium_andersonii.AAC.1
MQMLAQLARANQAVAEGERAAHQRSFREWKQWACAALSGGAARAHRWTKARPLQLAVSQA